MHITPTDGDAVIHIFRGFTQNLGRNQLRERDGFRLHGSQRKTHTHAHTVSI